MAKRGPCNCFQEAGGDEYLRLGDLSVPGDPEAHVGLARSGNLSQTQDAGRAGLDNIDLGPLKSNQADQNYCLLLLI